MKFYVIGIPNKHPDFSREQQERITNSVVFSGGDRHYDLVKHLLPKERKWIPIKAPMVAVYEAYRRLQGPIVVFASGNPLFYGMGNTLHRIFPEAEIRVFPAFSSIQILANRALVNSNALTTVSVHGRSWKALDVAVMQQLPLIGVLTDAKNSPKAIAERLIAYGYDNYTFIIGEDLEGTEEKITKCSIEEAKVLETHMLNCVILRRISEKPRAFGIANSDFKGLEGRPNMITKMPIRLTSLHYLEVLNKKTLWDIGFCTGSIAIEAKLKNPNLEVIAFEKRPECAAILEENTKRFGALGIQPVMGDFFTKVATDYPAPDSVFIGGHGGKMTALIAILSKVMPKDSVLVVNAVKEKSIIDFEFACKQYDFLITAQTKIMVDAHNAIEIIKAIKQ